MGDVKWIKVVVDIFDDEKMLLIESMPGRDSITVIWFKLLCLSGRSCSGGVLLLNSHIPYTCEMLATIFRRPLPSVRKALEVLEQFGMIETKDGAINIPNWGKHQNLDAIESRRGYMRDYMRDYTAKKHNKLDLEKVNNKHSVKPNCKLKINTLDIELEREGDIEPEGDIDICETATSCKQNKVNNRKFGEFQNVSLSETEMEKLGPSALQLIERLSAYKASTGKKYKSDYATLLNWQRKDGERSLPGKPAHERFLDMAEKFRAEEK